MTDETLRYYRDQAEAFVLDTRAVDMAPLYAHFLPHLQTDARILDAGCGSGRDARAFAERGFQVIAFDASPAMAAIAEARLGAPLAVLRFQEIAWRQAFDGIWACASLLHVPSAELPDVMHRLGRAMKPGGIRYASFNRHPTIRLCGNLSVAVRPSPSFTAADRTFRNCDASTVSGSPCCRIRTISTRSRDAALSGKPISSARSRARL